jgi:hypothetical protein
VRVPAAGRGHDADALFTRWSSLLCSALFTLGALTGGPVLLALSGEGASGTQCRAYSNPCSAAAVPISTTNPLEPVLRGAGVKVPAILTRPAQCSLAVAAHPRLGPLPRLGVAGGVTR